MTTIRASLMACSALVVLGAGFSASEARAAVDQYSIEAEAQVTINLEVCSAESQLAVRGDTGTDLDFYVSDPSGAMVHSDEGVDDYLSVVLAKEGEECETFSLGVSNLGEESNDFTVVLEPITAASTRVQKYIIGPNATQTVSFRACGTGATVTARGDGDTDLDYVIRNSDGAEVHSDDELSDETSAELAGLLNDCEMFEMDVANLGNVYNAMMLIVEPEGASEVALSTQPPSTSLAETTAGSGPRTTSVAEGSGAGDYRADANATLQVNLPICGATRVEVRGDGDTDLDFTLTDEGGDVVHSDFDLSDVTFVHLEPAGECENYSLAVDNLGEVYNDFSVALIDPEARGGTLGTGEYRVNAELATKVALRVCAVTKVRARGDGDTDLDFEVIDADGDTVHENYDLSDTTEFTLDPGGDCADFQMSVSNLGEVYNLLTVDFDGDINEPRSRTGKMARRSGGAAGATGSSTGGEDASRAISILNRTGESLVELQWSNSATLEWGADRLVDGQMLGRGQQWNVDVFDGSGACLFDFRGVTESAREIEVGRINVCEADSVEIE